MTRWTVHQHLEEQSVLNVWMKTEQDTCSDGHLNTLKVNHECVQKKLLMLWTVGEGGAASNVNTYHYSCNKKYMVSILHNPHKDFWTWVSAHSWSGSIGCYHSVTSVSVSWWSRSCFPLPCNQACEDLLDALNSQDLFCIWKSWPW